MLWSKVIYDGSHSGDFLMSEAVKQLTDEIDRLNSMENHHFDDTSLGEFLNKLKDLIRASESVNKPISF